MSRAARDALLVNAGAIIFFLLAFSAESWAGALLRMIGQGT